MHKHEIIGQLKSDFNKLDRKKVDPKKLQEIQRDIDELWSTSDDSLFMYSEEVRHKIENAMN